MYTSTRLSELYYLIARPQESHEARVESRLNLREAGLPRRPSRRPACLLPRCRRRRRSRRLLLLLATRRDPGVDCPGPVRENLGCTRAGLARHLGRPPVGLLHGPGRGRLARGRECRVAVLPARYLPRPVLWETRLGIVSRTPLPFGNITVAVVAMTRRCYKYPSTLDYKKRFFVQSTGCHLGLSTGCHIIANRLDRSRKIHLLLYHFTIFLYGPVPNDSKMHSFAYGRICQIRNFRCRLYTFHPTKTV